MCKESKGKLEKVRKPILNTCKTRFPKNLFVEENQQKLRKKWDVQGKKGKVRKDNPNTHKSPHRSACFVRKTWDA